MDLFGPGSAAIPASLVLVTNAPRRPTYTSVSSAASMSEAAGTTTLSMSLRIFIIPREFLSIVAGIVLVTGWVINRFLGTPVCL
jgi:hypothetical protein